MAQGRELHNQGTAPLAVLPEYKLWESHWIRCAQELGQWDAVVEFGKAAGNNPFNSEYMCHDCAEFLSPGWLSHQLSGRMHQAGCGWMSRQLSGF